LDDGRPHPVGGNAPAERPHELTLATVAFRRLRKPKRCIGFRTTPFRWIDEGRLQGILGGAAAPPKPQLESQSDDGLGRTGGMSRSPEPVAPLPTFRFPLPEGERETELRIQCIQTTVAEAELVLGYEAASVRPSDPLPPKPRRRRREPHPTPECPPRGDRQPWAILRTPAGIVAAGHDPSEGR